MLGMSRVRAAPHWMALAAAICRCSLGWLTIKVARNKGPPTSLFEAFLKEEDLGLKDLESIVGREVAAVHAYPFVTPTQTNPTSVSRKSAMLKSGLQTRIPALLGASWYQAEFSYHFCCSLMSNTSALLSLAVCIRRFWASLPLPRLSCRNFTFHLSTSGAQPWILGKNRSPKYGRHLFRPNQRKSGTEGEPRTPWPRVSRPHTSSRHPFCLEACSHATHDHIPGTWSTGQSWHALGCGSTPTPPSAYSPSFDDTLIASLDLAAVERLGNIPFSLGSFYLFFFFFSTSCHSPSFCGVWPLVAAA